MVEIKDRMPKTPDSFTVPTGFGEVIEEKKTEFFLGILDFIGYDQKARRVYARIESKGIYRENFEDVIETDDRITSLVVQGQLAATVLERRDEMNEIQAHFASYLTPEMIQRLREELSK